MYFSDEIERRCAYCQNSAFIDDERMICRKKGIVSPGYLCGRYRYDPISRVPAAQIAIEDLGYRQSDFDIE